MDEFILFLKKDLIFHIYTHIKCFFLLKLDYKLLQKKQQVIQKKNYCKKNCSLIIYILHSKLFNKRCIG